MTLKLPSKCWKLLKCTEKRVLGLTKYAAVNCCRCRVRKNRKLPNQSGNKQGLFRFGALYTRVLMFFCEKQFSVKLLLPELNTEPTTQFDFIIFRGHDECLHLHFHSQISFCRQNIKVGSFFEGKLWLR